MPGCALTRPSPWLPHRLPVWNCCQDHDGRSGAVAGLVSPGIFQCNVAAANSLANGGQPITANYGGLPTHGGTLLSVQQWNCRLKNSAYSLLEGSKPPLCAGSPKAHVPRDSATSHAANFLREEASFPVIACNRPSSSAPITVARGKRLALT